ncbi:MAG: hypothetical protein LBV75_00795 [Paludibacter sp.]|jgi:hypothetical protein|nr:hypothetical protein [Paludibacter sp.]
MKNFRKFVFIVLAALSLCACGDNEEPIIWGVYIDHGCTFRVQNSDGVDLLNPNNPNSYSKDSIEIYHVLNDGTVKLFYHQGLDSPYGFGIGNYGEQYLIGVMLNSLMKDTGDVTTYIKWNSTDIDTLYTTFISYRGNRDKPTSQGTLYNVWDKIWYNNVLILDNWEEYSAHTNELPVIIK